MLMDTIKKNHLLYGVVEKLKSFLRPFYDNGSSVTAEVENRATTYESYDWKKQYTRNKTITKGIV
jgi:hypothetical protein